MAGLRDGNFKYAAEATYRSAYIVKGGFLISVVGKKVVFRIIRTDANDRAALERLFIDHLRHPLLGAKEGGALNPPLSTTLPDGSYEFVASANSSGTAAISGGRLVGGTTDRESGLVLTDLPGVPTRLQPEVRRLWRMWLG